MTAQLDRRRFILLLSQIAAVLDSRPATAAAASTISNVEDLHVPVISEVATGKLIASSTAEIVKSYRGLAHALSNSGKDATKIARDAKAAAEGPMQINGPRVVSQLSDHFGQQNAVALGLKAYARDMYASGAAGGFDGVVHSGAARAFQIVSVIARGLAPENDVTKILAALPLPDDLDRTTKSVLMGMFKQSSESVLGKLARSPAFEAISGVKFSSPTRALVSELPKESRDLIRALLASPGAGTAGQKKALEAALAASVGKALPKMQANKRLEGYASAARDLQAIGTIGEFVLGKLFPNTPLARDFSKAINFAQIVLQIGFAFSTGGVGGLAGVSGIVSGLSSLQGMGESSADGATVMAQQLGAQIAELRAVMLAHFERVEALQERALDLLEAIRKELYHGVTSISSQIGEVETIVKSTDDKVTGFQRDNLIGDFQHTVRRVKIMIGRRTQSGEESKIEALSALLEYASSNKGASHSAFVSLDRADLKFAVRNARRVDLLVGLTGAAAETLGIRHTSNVSHNPVEWARGVQAYLEGSAALKVNEEVLKEQARECWDIGQQLRAYIFDICTGPNISTAADKYQVAVKAIKADLVARCRVTEKDRSPKVGALKEKQTVRLEIPGIAAIWGDPRAGGKAMYIANDKIISTGPVEDDLLTIALKYKRIELGPASPGGIQDIMGRVRSGQRRQIAKIMLSDIPSPSGPARVANIMDADLEKLFGIVREQMNDEADVGEWVSTISTLKDNGREPYAAFENVATALALYMTFVDWCIADQPDDPWHSGFASQMIRTVDDLQAVFSVLAHGASLRYLPLFRGTPYYGQLDAELPKDGKVRPYREMGIWLDFDVVVGSVIDNFIMMANDAKANSSARNSDRESRGASLGLLDRTLAKLGAHLSL